jgi:hypothetical protein
MVALRGCSIHTLIHDPEKAIAKAHTRKGFQNRISKNKTRIHVLFKSPPHTKGFTFFSSVKSFFSCPSLFLGYLPDSMRNYANNTRIFPFLIHRLLLKNNLI